ncbi:hypothetical protein ERJ75_000033500 [Trypanosoma vivax]|nr:hypothetical protein TRVL_00458 [Trypanosoma vivax]KAH8620677.1 hypothetical protein ERJ75_000033500 [Trypanosoma vivax]
MVRVSSGSECGVSKTHVVSDLESIETRRRHLWEQLKYFTPIDEVCGTWSHHCNPASETQSSAPHAASSPGKSLHSVGPTEHEGDGDSPLQIEKPLENGKFNSGVLSGHVACCKSASPEPTAPSPGAGWCTTTWGRGTEPTRATVGTMAVCSASRARETKCTSRRLDNIVPAGSSAGSLSFQPRCAYSVPCSVYPHLQAEFWCSLCDVLVSSRCHVTGTHKDHPFIPLQEAAEKHLHELRALSTECDHQFRVAQDTVRNLEQCKSRIRESAKEGEKALGEYYQRILSSLSAWYNQLKLTMQQDTKGQLEAINTSVQRTTTLMEYYKEQRNSCTTLLMSPPPCGDGEVELWSLRVMDLVSRLRSDKCKPDSLPFLTVPRVKSTFGESTCKDLLTVLNVPLDAGVANAHKATFSRESASRGAVGVSFTLKMTDEANKRGALIYSGSTLTRSHDALPIHALVCASHTLTEGVAAWEVRADRVGGNTPGRILAGVLLAGSGGDGVVCDGRRVVGPSAGESRIVPEGLQWPHNGATLRFVIALQVHLRSLVIYSGDIVVASIPLPHTPCGWIPAFSVLSAEDQITVVPLSAARAMELLAGAMGDPNVIH